MTEYAFPRDLLDSIKTRWQTAADQHFELPEDRILQELLETCYHASFRTSEQRVVQCVVAYASFADIREGALRLSRPVVLTDSELVRLSPVTLTFSILALIAEHANLDARDGVRVTL